jgi:hypothetical protein
MIFILIYHKDQNRDSLNSNYTRKQAIVSKAFISLSFSTYALKFCISWRNDFRNGTSENVEIESVPSVFWSFVGCFVCLQDDRQQANLNTLRFFSIFEIIKTRWHTRRTRMRNAVRRLFEFSIIDKGIIRKKRIIVSTIECRTFFCGKDISNPYWNEFFLSVNIIKKH